MPGTRKGAGRSGVVTGLSSLAVAGSAAGAGILLAHFFGRNERTDGLFVAYGVYLVLAIAAQAFRTVVLPQLTRETVALGSETRAYLLALGGAGIVAVGTARDRRRGADRAAGHVRRRAAVRERARIREGDQPQLRVPDRGRARSRDGVVGGADLVGTAHAAGDRRRGGCHARRPLLLA